MFWVKKCPVECSGFGLVSYDNELKQFTVSDAFMLEQIGTSSHTDIDGASLAKLMYKTKDVQNKYLKFWWHSHVNMATFWSGTDLATIKELGGAGWITATVFNKKGDYKSAACWKSSSELGSSVSINDDIPTEIETLVDQAKIDLWAAEYALNFKPVPIPTFQGYNLNHEGYLNGDDDYLAQSRSNKISFGSSQKWQQITEKKQTKKEKQENKTNPYWYTGYYGYGAVKEAKAINMNVTEYCDALVYGSAAQLEKIEADLLASEKIGALK